MVMGWDDLIVAGIAAYGSYQSANMTNSANAGINAQNAQQAADFFAHTQREQRMYNEENRAFANAQAVDQRVFQERMGSNAHQRAVLDLKAAGLNPALAVTQPGAMAQGAMGSAPTGSAATGQVPQKMAMQAPNLSSAADATRVKMEYDRQEAITDNIRADTAEKASRVPQSMMAAQKMEAEIQNLVMMRPKIESEIQNIASSTYRNLAEERVATAYEKLIKAQQQHEMGKLELTAVMKAKGQLENVLLQLSTPGAEAKSESDKTWWGRNIRPYFQEGMQGAGAITRGMR